MKWDLAVVGGGIVGLSVAWQYLRLNPKKKVLLLEKEAEPGAHQTGHNSGVIHSGIYYKPGSLKAKNCRRGKKMLEAFCEEHGIPYERCGKVIVATSERELPTLNLLYERGKANGVDCEMIGPGRLGELEPHANGIRAIYVREAGIVDFKAVCLKLAELIRGLGGEVVLGAEVVGIREEGRGVVLDTTKGAYVAERFVNCAGLHSDRVAKMAGVEPGLRIVPFRGEYYEIRGESKGLVRNLIYPVPDPKFPFLGIHLTRMIDGRVECGPNAVLALAREGYTKTSFNLRDAMETLLYSGFLRLAARHLRVGLVESLRSWFKPAFVRAVRRLVPEIRAGDLVPAPAGVRAQALLPDGTPVDDFVIKRSGKGVHVLNAPSPAATACLNIGLYVAELVEA